MRYPDQHLSADEFESLGQGEGLSDGREENLGAAREHVQSCPSCRRRLEVYLTTGAKLEKLRAPRGVPKGPDCPSVEIWLELAGGLLTTADKERHITHAATCDHCGPALREIVHDFEEPVTEEEKSVLAGLKSPGSIPQPRSATQVLPPKVIPRPKRWFVLPGWQLATAAVVILAAVSFSLYKVGIFRKEDSVASVNRLLAQAYTEQRTIEPRIPGAKYAPMRVQRGPGGSNLNKPPSLLEAEALISKGLRQNQDDPAWLQAKARADLLDGNYDAAINSLQRALESNADSPNLMMDLGTAYLERADSTGNTRDYGNAAEWLGNAVARASDDPVVLFNHAIVCEKLFLYSQAIEDWEHYLRIDPIGDWANEGRQRLSAVRKKQREHDRARAEPLLEPTRLAHVKFNDTAIRKLVDERIEEYLRLAVRDWLPGAFPNQQPMSNKDEFKGALEFLASLTMHSHADKWLADLVVGSGANFRQAVEELSRAAKANDAGHYEIAEEQSLKAERHFVACRNTAGVLRARVERIFALHLSHQGSFCLRAVTSTAPQMGMHAYTWVKIQYQLESSSCHALMGDLGDALGFAKSAIKQAKSSKYGNSYLRALGFASQDSAEAGDLKAAWVYARLGLERFWSGNYIQMMGYNLYTDLDTAAEAVGQPHLQVAIWRQALTVLATDEDTLLRAMALSSAGNAAFAAGANESAEQEFREAARLFAELPQAPAVRNDRIEAETWLARVEAQRGRLTQALLRLKQIQAQVSLLSDNYVAIKFYTTLGALQLSGRENADAARNLRSAIVLAELTLRTLKSERERLMWNQKASEPYRELVKWMLEQGETQGALELWEWYKGAALRNSVSQITDSAHEFIPSLPQQPLVEGSSLPNLTQVKNELSRLVSVTVLSYAILSDRAVVWKYDDRGISAVWIAASAAELQRKAEHFKRLCADPRSDMEELRQNARSLYDLLFTPLEQQLQAGRTLVIEADGFLAGIALEALLDPYNHYLGDSYSIVSSFAFAYNRRPSTQIHFSPDTSALVVSVSRSRLSGEPLPKFNDSVYEASAVARGFHHAHFLEDSQATSAAILRQLAAIQVFHFAGHAIASADRVGLLLSDTVFDPGLVRPDRLTHLRLVVLSACDTERGTNGRYDDVDSFARVFNDAGVPHIVASRWQVDSASTSAFMASFYKKLLSGETVSGSLRDAAQHLRSHSETAHPYYWAAFGLFGQT